MGTIGDPITQQIPPVNSAGPAYASGVNNFLGEVKLRLETGFPTTALNPAGGIDMEDNQLDNVSYVGFTPQDAPPSGSPTSRWESYNGDIYWVGPQGAVRIVNGGVLDVSSSGGIGGDYGTTAAAFVYDDTNKVYRAYSDGTALNYAFIAAFGFDVGSDLAGAFTARIRFAGIANQTYTLPDAPSDSGHQVVTMDDTGKMYADGNVSSVVTHGADIVLSGTTKIQHGTRTIIVNPAFTINQGGVGASVDQTTGLTRFSALGGIVKFFVPAQVGWTLVNARLHINKQNTSNTTIFLMELLQDGSSTNVLRSVTTATSGVSVPVTISGTTHACLSGARYYVHVNAPTTSSGGDTIDTIEVDYVQNE